MPDGRERLDHLTVRRPCALVFGSEGEGLPTSFHNIGTSVQIPQTTAIDSLNLAMVLLVFSVGQVGVGLMR